MNKYVVPAKMRNNRKKPLCVIFMNQDFGETRTGIENSALLRKDIFQNFLGINPVIATLTHRANYFDIRQVALRNGLMASDDVMLNLYNHFQGLDGEIDIERPVHRYSSSFRSELVPGTPGDERIYDSDENLLMYIFKSRVTGKVLFINYMNGLKPHRKWRREHFHEQGFLITTQFIDEKTDQTTHEFLYRPDGTMAIAKHFHMVGDERRLSFIQIFDEQGRITEHFKTEEDLLGYWLPRLINDADKDYCLILDRPRVYYKALTTVRKNIDPRIELKIVPVIHAVHVNDAKQIETGRTNNNYKAVLDDIFSVDALITLTSAQAADIMRRYGAGNVKVIPHAYSSHAERADFSQRETLNVVYLARYAAEKQHSVALEAFAKVLEVVPAAQLHLYGSGPKRKEIEEKINASGLQESVFVHDFRQDVATILENAGISILTSTSESFSLSVLESLAHACPVVAFDVPYGPRALIEEGVNGYLVPFNDTEQLAARIIQLLQNPVLHEQMSRHARASAQRFLPENITSLWNDLFDELFPPDQAG